MKREHSLEELKAIARRIRRDVVQMIGLAGSGHPGGSLSIVEILVCLYFEEMRYDPTSPNWEDRDRFVLSKGHACPAWYAVLAECGFFPREELWTLRKLGSILQGHPACRYTPGVDSSSGSLGQGLSVANGMALGARISKKHYRVYCILGDGEVEEGQIWEAAMSAAHYKLDNLCVFLDNNNLQIDGDIREIMNPHPLREKWDAFGWHTIEIDGHSFVQILAALEEARVVKGKPTIVIAHTIKGKGVSFMENAVEWHGKAPNEEELSRALEELSG